MRTRLVDLHALTTGRLHESDVPPVVWTAWHLITDRLDATGWTDREDLIGTVAYAADASPRLIAELVTAATEAGVLRESSEGLRLTGDQRRHQGGEAVGGREFPPRRGRALRCAGLSNISRPRGHDTMTTEHEATLDQARAAAAHGNVFRIRAERAGRLLAVVEGPLAEAALRWHDMPGREMLGCEHLPATSRPQPLFGTLRDPGRLYCLGCAPAMAGALTPRCDGCGSDFDPATLPARDVVIGLDNFLTLIGIACPDCRALCQPPPCEDQGEDPGTGGDLPPVGEVPRST